MGIFLADLLLMHLTRIRQKNRIRVIEANNFIFQAYTQKQSKT